MTREEEFIDSREGLLKDEHDLHPNQDDLHSSDSGMSLDELEVLEHVPVTPRLRGGWSPKRRKKNGVQPGHPRLPSKRKGGWLRHKTWMLIGAIVIGLLVGILGGFYGGTMFKPTGLQDGVRL